MRRAVEEMLEHTDVPDAPWVLVEGDSKRWARVRVLEETITAIEAGMRRVGVPVPEPL
jgi:AMP-polyphosphate phosphotransferase